MKIKIYTSVFLIVQTLTAKNILDFQVKSFKVISNRYGNIESNRTTLAHERIRPCDTALTRCFSLEHLRSECQFSTVVAAHFLVN